MRSRSPRCCGGCEHPGLEPSLAVEAELLAPHLAGLVVARVEDAVVLPERVQAGGRHEGRHRLAVEPRPGDLVAERDRVGGAPAGVVGDLFVHAGVGLEPVGLERVPDVCVVLARTRAMNEPEEIVHLLAVHRVAGVVARRNREHVRVAPVAAAPVPGVEARGRDRQDPGQEVAAIPEVGTRWVLGAGGDVPAPATVVAVARNGLAGALAHDLEPLVEPRGELSALAVDVDDAFACDAAHEIGPDDTQGTIACPLREPEHCGAYRLQLEGIRGDARTAPERELAELLAAVGVDDRKIHPAADAYAACRRNRRGVELVILVPDGAVTEELHVPVRGLREDRVLFRLEIGPDPGEVADLGATQLGVGFAGRRRGTRHGAVTGAPGRGTPRPPRTPSPAAARTWCRPAGEGTG